MSCGFGNFLWIDQNYNVTGYPPQYLASQVITKEWVQPIDAPPQAIQRPQATSTTPREMSW